jgi:hypothetical protein
VSPAGSLAVAPHGCCPTPEVGHVYRDDCRGAVFSPFPATGNAGGTGGLPPPAAPLLLVFGVVHFHPEFLFLQQQPPPGVLSVTLTKFRGRRPLVDDCTTPDTHTWDADADGTSSHPSSRLFCLLLQYTVSSTAVRQSAVVGWWGCDRPGTRCVASFSDTHVVLSYLPVVNPPHDNPPLIYLVTSAFSRDPATSSTRPTQASAADKSLSTSEPPVRHISKCHHSYRLIRARGSSSR